MGTLRRFGARGGVAQRVERLLRRQRVHRAAWVLTSAVGAWAAFTLAHGPRERIVRAVLRFAPLAFVFAAALAGGAALLATSVDERTSPKPFLALAACAFALVLTATSP